MELPIVTREIKFKISFNSAPADFSSSIRVSDCIQAVRVCWRTKF